MYMFIGRSESRGQEAIKQLNGEGLKPLFHQLDLDDVASIDRLKTFLQTTYSGLDILVNNAGIAFKVRAYF
jgi:NAD(P)-dependent dehydrogenase (short-subunit alcohol dehydrogenase family)